jgi:hypothetical protein
VIKSQAFTTDYDRDILPPDEINNIETQNDKDEWDIANVM